MPGNVKLPVCDVMISYTEKQQDFAEKFLIDRLKKTNLKVSHENPGKAKTHSSRAHTLLACKVYLPIFCPDSVTDTTIKDEIALAYISNKSIIPLSRSGFRKINDKISSGMKLMLAKINWVFFTREDQYEEAYTNLVDVLKQEVETTRTNTVNEGMEGEEEVYEPLNNHAPGVMATSEQTGEADEEECEHTEHILNCDFWERHFSSKSEVPWTEFKDTFIADYEERIIRNVGEERVKWMTNILYKDIFDLNKSITRQIYRRFTGRNTHANPDEFFDRLSDYSRGSYAMREVFDMDSTVRLTAIQNMASFHTAGVITQLLDLVSDSDPNIRAVAALALAKSGRRLHRITDKLIRMCQDEDRVVRESACLSLAHMKCHQAVPHIVDLWRNDAIKHVRDAAELALNRIGGEEAEGAMKVTKVLSQEMNNLRSLSSARKN